MLTNIFALSILSLLLVTTAQARVFSVKDEKLAAYVRATYAPTKFENTLFSKSHGSGSTLDSDIAYDLSGEFGLIYATSWVNVRFGLELIKPPDKTDQKATDSSGAQLYTMTSEVSVLVPKIGFDINLKKWNTSRIYIGGTAGYANLVARNSYVLTTAGTTQYTGVTDFYEDLRAQAPQYEGLLGFEGLLSDTTTYAIEAGYRSLVFSDINHNRGVTTFKGAVNKDDHALNDDGSARSLDLTQIYMGFNFRFWIF